MKSNLVLSLSLDQADQYVNFPGSGKITECDITVDTLSISKERSQYMQRKDKRFSRGLSKVEYHSSHSYNLEN